LSVPPSCFPSTRAPRRPPPPWRFGECARDIAALERSSARQTKGQERRQIIVALGKIKTACYNGHIKQAYSAAEKLRKSPQQASAGN
jgi:hypothetical protein